MFGLFRCPTCEDKPSFSNFPLCKACATALTPVKQLCQQCWGACSASQCLRPWIQRSLGFELIANYWLMPETHTILKKWKTMGGPLLSAQVLKPAPILTAFLDALSEQKQSIDLVPMPQREGRFWELGQHPALEICLWLHQELKRRGLKSVIHENALGLQGNGPAQAMLSAHQRLERSIGFFVHPEFMPSSRHCLLVDDFVTTGQTITEASELLISKVSTSATLNAFCLGLRPRTDGAKAASDLLKGPGGTVGVSKEMDPFQLGVNNIF